MSRRESRASLDARQNDALFEFENFKKKFLLANKHITKLNSTLSVRIEELNAQISTLYTENLRLRSSEIALAAQLKREREKSRQIIAETEIAALGLTRHLSFLRQAFKISEPSLQSPSPTPPKATRRPASQRDSSPTSPIVPKLSREPTIPDIHEEEEPPSSSDEAEEPPEVKLSPRRKAKAKARLSASRLPLPSRIASPPPPELSASSGIPHQIDFESIHPITSKRKPSRRQSGLVIDTRMSTEDERPAGSLFIRRPSSPAFGSPIRKAAGMAEERDENGACRNVDREFDEIPMIVKKPKSSSKREKEKATAAVEPAEKKKGKAREDGEGNYLTEGKKSKLKDVTNSPISRAVSTPIDAAAISELESGPPSAPSSHLPTPSPPPGEGEDEIATGGRERRARKAVSYTEPKLNTKMRKTEPPEGTTNATTIRKRSSSSTSVRSSMPYKSRSEEPPQEEATDTDVARSSVEREEPIRSRLASILDTPAALPPASSNPLRRHKSRPVIIEDGDDDLGSDGAEADEEWVPSNARASWVNVSERRRGVSGKDRRATSGSSALSSLEDRRHSLAI